jgi:hypothetical protein
MRAVIAALIFLLGCQSRGGDGAAPSPPSKPRVEPRSATEVAPARDEHLAKLWDSMLGHMYHSFLFTERREEVPEQARKLAEAVYSDLDQLTARLAAMRKLNNDLYLRDELTPEVQSRITMLEEELSADRQEAQKAAVFEILKQVPFVFLAAVPMGSPVVRAELSNFLKGRGVRAVAWFKGRAQPPVAPVQWRRMRRDFLEGYEVGKTWDAFSKTAIPYTLYELFKVEQKIDGSGEGLPIEEVEIISDLIPVE